MKVLSKYMERVFHKERYFFLISMHSHKLLNLDLDSNGVC